MTKVEVCSACWKAGAEISNEEFLEELKQLQDEVAEHGVSVERMGCQRFCPPNKVTVAIENRMTMALQANRDSIRTLILGHINRK